MRKFDVVDAWLSNVAYSHSNSSATQRNYHYHFAQFCEFIGCMPQQILEDYEKLHDREFKRKYARFLRAFITEAMRKGYAVGTVTTMTTPIKSFFKYNDLPLGFTPVAQTRVTYHNRDITHEEIVQIMNVSDVRDAAFYAVMAQSGLRPITLSKLKRKHLESELKGRKAYWIKVPVELAKGEYKAHFSFIGEDAVNRLERYFTTRGTVNPNDYVFTAQGLAEPVSPKSISGLFAKRADRLKDKGKLDFEQKEAGKPRSVRLYNLRKFFRKYAWQAGADFVNFWMGHKANYQADHIPSSDSAYFSKDDVEYHRDHYIKTALPNLRLETPIATAQDVLLQRQADEIAELRKRLESRNAEIAELKKRVAAMEQDARVFLAELKEEVMAEIQRRLKTGAAWSEP